MTGPLDLRARAAEQARPVSRAGFAGIVAIWLLLGGLALWLLVRSTAQELP